MVFILTLLFLTACNLPGRQQKGTGTPSDPKIPNNSSQPSLELSNATASAVIRIFPDGSGDYPSLIQAVENAPAGANIILGAGTYELTDYLDIEKSLAITGAGMNQTIITSNIGEDAIGFYGPGSIALADLTIQYTGTEPSDVFLVDNGTVTISNCRFTGGIADTGDDAIGYGVGLFIQGTSGGIIRDSLFDANQSGGMVIINDSSITIQGNTFTANSDSGLTLKGSYSGLVEGNTSTANELHGIALMENSSATVNSNDCSSNENSGIVFFDNSVGSAKGNETIKNGFHGISILGNSHPLLEENTCSENTYDGIAYFENAYGTARGNNCLKNIGNGLSAADNSSPVVESNIFSYNLLSGISFYPGSAGSAQGNTCAFNGWGIYVEKGADPSLGSNTVYSNTTADVLDER
jgi:parallel beta-helix repeat protein